MYKYNKIERQLRRAGLLSLFGKPVVLTCIRAANRHYSGVDRLLDLRRDAFTICLRKFANRDDKVLR